jgi:hypothetical protein
MFLLIEKNEVVNIEERRNLKAKQEGMARQQRISPQRITLAELFDQTIAREGADKFWSYDAIRNNCQDFVMMLLLTLYPLGVPPPLKAFIKQDQIDKIVTSPIMQKMAKEVTDLAGWFRRILGK